MLFLEIIRKFWCDIKLISFQIRFRKRNSHNFTRAMSIFDMSKVYIGNNTYGNLNIKTFKNDNELLKIGNYCSISNNVFFILGGEHNYNYFSTYPFKVKLFNDNNESLTKGPIIVDDDVWIGYGAMILSGVHIGKGAVIGAGAVVTKSIPEYSIVVGNPAKIIKYRFDQDIISEMKKIDFSNLNITKENVNLMYYKVDKELLNSIKENIIK